MPARDSPFRCINRISRICMPGEAVVSGTGKQPPVHAVPSNERSASAALVTAPCPTGPQDRPDETDRTSHVKRATCSGPYPMQVIPPGTNLHLTPRTLFLK